MRTKSSGWYVLVIVVFALIFISSCEREQTGITPTPTQTPAATASPIQTETPQPSESCCSSDLISKGYKCIQDCGPPVVRPTDPTPGYRCLSPEEQESRNTYGCPKCLAKGTKIATPDGDIAVEDIKPGMEVYTVAEGKKQTVAVKAVSSTEVHTPHRVITVVLDDGRSLTLSPNHPLTNGKTAAELAVGESYDGSTVASLEYSDYLFDKTYDILPEGDTGFYYANDILVASTLSRQ